MTHTSAQPKDRYIRWTELQQIVPLSRSRIWVLEQQEKFPKRRKIGGRAVAWLESEVNAWLKSREAA